MVKQFMQPTKDLQFIYMPMRDIEHRYLMVISIHDSVLWQLNFYFEDNDFECRRDKMTTVAVTVEHILKSDIYKECKLKMKENMRRWRIYAPREIPNRHQSRDSPSWVLQWMNLEHALDSQCSEVHVLDKNSTQMYTTM
ncbi:uncharacterized protein LOC107637898 [Arachis ipaensis]|uniref:uncharacterized protein LOC107637898 n=1 Tax=Arachis ipaensis TaxID=130454 RepID=UPI0007AF3749|nr:uncharacterized protein LOC107637898 [Arachis ipaensis]